MQNTPFTWQRAQERAIDKRIKHLKDSAKSGNPDLKLKHPDWVRDAQLETPIYTLLETKTREEMEQKQEIYRLRQEKKLAS